MKSLLLGLFIFLLITSIAIGSDVDVKIHGFGSIVPPVGGNNSYQLRWLQLTADATEESKFGYIQIDVSNPKLVLGYGGIRLSYHLSLTGGEILNPVWDPYPGPMSLWTVSWPKALDTFPCSGTGMVLEYNNGIKIQLATYNQNSLAVMAAWKGLAIIGDKDVGMGTSYTSSFSSFLNPSVGVVRENGGEYKGWVENYVSFPYNFRLYANADFCEHNKRSSIGVVHQYSDHSFLKLFYEWPEELKAEMTMTFSL